MRKAAVVLNALLAGLFAYLAWRSRRDGDWWWFAFAVVAAGNVVMAVLKFRAGAARARE